MKRFLKWLIVAGAIAISCFGYGFYRYQKGRQSAVMLTQMVTSDFISKNHPDENFKKDLVRLSNAIANQWSWRAWDIDLAVVHILRSGTVTNEQSIMIHDAVVLIEQSDVSEQQRKTFIEKHKAVFHS